MGRRSSKRRRRKAMVLFLENCKDKCEHCGTKDNLTFHHVDATNKSFTLGSLRNRAWRQLYAEVKKCIVVCRKCHNRIHRLQ